MAPEFANGLDYFRKRAEQMRAQSAEITDVEVGALMRELADYYDKCAGVPEIGAPERSEAAPVTRPRPALKSAGH